MNVTIARAAPASRPRNGMPEWKPYRYQGTGVDTLTPELGSTEDAEDLFILDAEPCWCAGDLAAYRRHLANGEEVCRASRDAVNAYHRERAPLKDAARCDGCHYSVTSANHRAICGAS